MPLDKEKASKNLKDIIEKMHEVTDTALLHEYYKIYKKEISFFRRSWAAAWLFMYYDGKEIPSLRKTEKPHVNNTKTNKVQEKIDPLKKSAELPEKSLSEPLCEDESKRLFFSIGKNRRLFPREVITLIMANTTTAREDIGIIRILDNYSFVQVRDVKADEIIEKLTGLRFRGRTLAVNYAKPKTNETDSEE